MLHVEVGIDNGSASDIVSLSEAGKRHGYVLKIQRTCILPGPCPGNNFYCCVLKSCVSGIEIRFSLIVRLDNDTVSVGAALYASLNVDAACRGFIILEDICSVVDLRAAVHS